MAESIISPGVLARENDISFIQPAPVEASAAIIGPTVKGPVERPTVVTSYGQYLNIFGSTFTSASVVHEYITSIAAKNFFDNGGSSLIVARVQAGSFTSAQSSKITASAVNNNSFILKTHSQGTIMNGFGGSAGDAYDASTDEDTGGAMTSGTEDNLRWEISNIDNGAGTFTLTIRRGDDTTSNKIVLETFTNLSLDPNSPNYIEKQIGNQFTSIATDGTSKYVKTSGDEVNKSKYVYVSQVVTPTLNYLGNDGVTVGKDGNNVSYSGSLPVATSGSFCAATGTIGGGLMFTQISDTNSQGLLGAADDYNDIIDVLSNKDEYVYNVISAPGLIYANTTKQKGALDRLISMVETRGDAIAVVDLVGYGSTVAQTTTQASGLNSSYAASYWPWLQMPTNTGKNKFVPASTVIPGVFAFNDSAAAPWFAPAGLVRGGLVGVIQAEQKLARSQRDTLYNGKVNPIATFPGSGIAVFGQKTLQTKASALDRVNVRRLLINLKKFLGDQASNLVFEQNTTATRNNFLAAVNPYLESVVQRQGLFAFRVVMDDTNNTADVVDRNQLVGQIFIQPAKTAEFIVLDFTIEPTGATFS
jgi:hypothetical protein